MGDSVVSLLDGGSGNATKSIRSPIKRKSAKKKPVNGFKRDGRFSLHFSFGRTRFTLFLVQYQVPNTSIGSFDYDNPPPETSVLELLQRNSHHVISTTRAMEKWKDVISDRLPKVIAERERELLYEPKKKVSQNLEGLLVASKLSIAEDKYLSSKESRQMFVDIRKSLWAIQTLVSTARGWSGAFDVDDVKHALDEVRRGISCMHRDDPRGVLNPEHKKLAKYIWEWWESVQPILSNKGNWGMTLRASKEDTPEVKTISDGAVASEQLVPKDSLA
ncbi:hypothetical protein ACIQAL_09370 [Pseudomonas sp. NPDC088368]|uniref:hypothetical protein n=1 Tax=Pseudomonas sp. NPDC088368 TaxID=3364453 RepID=UPI003824DE25